MGETTQLWIMQVAPLLYLRREGLCLAESTTELIRELLLEPMERDGASPSLRALAESTRGPIKKLLQNQSWPDVPEIVSPGSRSCTLRADGLITRYAGRAAPKSRHLAVKPTKKKKRGASPHRSRDSDVVRSPAMVVKGSLGRVQSPFPLSFFPSCSESERANWRNGAPTLA
jgi:hypothetical protein